MINVGKQTSAQSLTLAQSFEQLLKVEVAQENYRSARSAWLSLRFGSETDPDTSSNGSDDRVTERIPALQSYDFEVTPVQGGSVMVTNAKILLSPADYLDLEAIVIAKRNCRPAQQIVS